MKQFENYLKTVTLHSERERAVADHAFRYALKLANTWHSIDTAPKDHSTFRVKTSSGAELHAVGYLIGDFSIDGRLFSEKSLVDMGFVWQPIPELKP